MICHTVCKQGIEEHGLSNFFVSNCENHFPELHQAHLALLGQPKQNEKGEEQNLVEALRAVVLLANVPCPFWGDEDLAIKQFGDMESVVHAICDDGERGQASGIQLAVAAVAAFKSVENNKDAEGEEDEGKNDEEVRIGLFLEFAMCEQKGSNFQIVLLPSCPNSKG